MSPDYVIDSSVSAAGMVNYDDFLHYMSNFNWSGDHEADLASLIAAGVDPFQYLLNNLNRSAMDFPDWLSYLNTTSSDEEVTDYIWEAGKIIRIPLYRYPTIEILERKKRTLITVQYCASQYFIGRFS